jgi:hypothetical protein
MTLLLYALYFVRVLPPCDSTRDQDLAVLNGVTYQCDATTETWEKLK